MATEVSNGHTESMLLIFGLSSAATPQQVRVLLGRGEDTPVHLIHEPGAQDNLVALVHLPANRALARQLAHRVRLQRLHNRSLQAWVPALAWG